MASICGSPCTKIVYTVALDEVNLIEINPPTDFVSQKITITFGVGNDMQEKIATTSSFAKDNGQKFTPFSSFAKDIQNEQIGMSFGSSKVKVSDYHLIFNLNGVLVAIGEGQTRSRLVLKLDLKEFFFIYVNRFMMYTWSSIMKRNFSRHLDIITEKTSILLLTSRILDQTFCFKNDHFDTYFS
jgi:hypothetical protein